MNLSKLPMQVQARNLVPSRLRSLQLRITKNKDKDGVFSDNEDEASESSKSINSCNPPQVSSTSTAKDATLNSKDGSNQIANLTRKTEQVSLGTSGSTRSEPSKEAIGVDSTSDASKPVEQVSEFKAMAAEASTFSFGDDDDSENV